MAQHPEEQDSRIIRRLEEEPRIIIKDPEEQDSRIIRRLEEEPRIIIKDPEERDSRIIRRPAGDRPRIIIRDPAEEQRRRITRHPEDGHRRIIRHLVEGQRRRIIRHPEEGQLRRMNQRLTEVLHRMIILLRIARRRSSIIPANQMRMLPCKNEERKFSSRVSALSASARESMIKERGINRYGE